MKKFDIHMSEQVFKVGTDATLLGALSPLLSPGRYLDIGTGTGIVALMLAQRDSISKIDGVDSNKAAAILAKNNFSISPYRNRLSSIHSSLHTYKATGLYTHIFSNPPYYQAGKLPEKSVLATAKYQNALEPESILTFCTQSLVSGGHLSMIYPCYYGRAFKSQAAAVGLHLIESVGIKSKSSSAVIRLVDTYRFSDSESEESRYSELVLYQKDRAYSDEARSFLKPFLTKL